MNSEQNKDEIKTSIVNFYDFLDKKLENKIIYTQGIENLIVSPKDYYNLIKIKNSTFKQLTVELLEEFKKIDDNYNKYRTNKKTFESLREKINSLEKKIQLNQIYLNEKETKNKRLANWIYLLLTTIIVLILLLVSK